MEVTLSLFLGSGVSFQLGALSWLRRNVQCGAAVIYWTLLREEHHWVRN